VKIFARLVLAFGSPWTGHQLLGRSKSASRAETGGRGSTSLVRDIRRAKDIDIEIEIATPSRTKTLRRAFTRRVWGIPVVPVLGNVLGCVYGVPMLNVLSSLMNLRMLTKEKGMTDPRLDKEDLRRSVSALRQAKKVELSQASLVQQLDKPMADVYAAAEGALNAGDEVGARAFLEEWQTLRNTREAAEAELRLASDIVASMQESLAELMRQMLEDPERPIDLKQLLSICASDPSEEVGLRLCVRYIYAKKEAADLPELELEDPLERKFRELGQ